MLFWDATLLLAALALKTTGAPAGGTRPGCETSPAMVGGTGSINTFHFRKGLNMSSDIFHAYVIRTGDTVCGVDRQNKRFRIHTKPGFKIDKSDPDHTFATLTGLVDNYRQRDIVHEGISFGKLGKSFEVKPTEEWYAGELSRDGEKTLFESKGHEHGSFLIRNNITYPDYYTLAVNIGGETKPFCISLDDNCFELRDANTKFKSLVELVNHYKTNDIVTHEGNLGRLGNPIRAGTDSE